MTARVVAIDGPAGSGKSTVARGLAAALGLPTLDTGAMYRASALAALDAGVDLADAGAVTAVARAAAITVEHGVTTLDGRDVSAEIRGPRVTGAVSQVSGHPSVRAVLVERQRTWVAQHGGGVVEGRDIGTVVLPDAPLKVFITARDEVRAARRQRDEAEAERSVEADAVRDALNQRDRADGTLGRATRPEDAAPDAIVVDTSDVTAEEVISDLVARAAEAFEDRVGSSMTFYQFARGVVLSVFKLVFRVRVVGKDRVPTKGAYILAPSHRSILDVPFAAYVTRRTVRFLAKDDLFSSPLGRKLFDALGAVEVERGTADRGAMRALEAVLERGEPVAIFPEGTRHSGPEIAELFAGAAYLSVKFGVPIVPVGIGGSEHILPKGKLLPRIHRVAVSVGEPLSPPVLEGRARRSAAKLLTDRLQVSLQACFDDAERLAR